MNSKKKDDHKKKSDQITPEIRHVDGLIREFRTVRGDGTSNTGMRDRKFAFILGAGASVSSGIPAASTLVREWVALLYERNRDKHKYKDEKEWAESADFPIHGFELNNAAKHYSQVYDECFRDDRDLGFYTLEESMRGARPHIGYSILAKILVDTDHKVVITTNFDDLVAQALLTYTGESPLVCGHESLAGFVRANPRRPLIAKIHRDLLMAPKSSEDDVKTLPDEWRRALNDLFNVYIPVVIGYGGNDGSLMGFLESLDVPQGNRGIYWCYHEKSGLPDAPTQKLVKKLNGVFIPIAGFDELMVLLGAALDVPILHGAILEEAEERAKWYREEYEKLLKKVKESKPREDANAPNPLVDAMVSMATREKNWWGWQQQINAEPDPDKQDAMYRAGLENFPGSPELTTYYASFLQDIRKDYDAAERLYKRALELDPNHAIIAGNYALFLQVIRKDYDEAERLYKRALELDPNHAGVTGNYASFLKVIRKDYDEAERLYKRALELDPNRAGVTGNYASFLKDIRKDYDEAERLYKRALELDPNHAGVTSNYALFLKEIRKDYDAAERLYKRALELDPDHASIMGNYASFLQYIRKDYDAAERLYKRALDLDPNDADYTGNYASLLIALGRLAEAASMIVRAWSADSEPRGQVSAEVAFYAALMLVAQQRETEESLGRLKSILDQGYVRGSWSFDTLLELFRDTIPAGDWDFYKTLSEAILDEEMVQALDAFPQWKDVKPISLDEPWEFSLT